MTPPETANQNPNQRDQAWLENQLAIIWDTHFPDVAKLNVVRIKWGRPTRTRLGTITVKGGSVRNPDVSEIKVNALLQDITIPQSVVWQTIAHELSHYTHGFCSPHPRLFSHPHKGNVIQKELIKRDLGQVYTEAEVWLKNNWHTHVAQTIGRSPIRKRRIHVRRKRVSLLSHLNQIITRGHRLGD